MKFVAIPPPYDKKYYLDNPLPGSYRFAVGKGSAYKTLQIIGGAPPNDVDVDIGWTQVHISSKGKELTMTFGGGQDAANERWDAERAEMDELAKESYAERPQHEITQKIPKLSRQTRRAALLYELRELQQENGETRETQEENNQVEIRQPDEIDEYLKEQEQGVEPRRIRVYNKEKSIVRRRIVEAGEVYPSLPVRTYLGRRLRPVNLQVRL